MLPERFVVCKVCGVAFERPRKPGHPPKYCSEACRREERRTRSLAYYYANLDEQRARGRERQAKNKGRPLPPSATPERRHARYMERKGGPTRQYVCAVCEKPFERPRRPGRPPTVCSTECRAEDNRRRAKDWSHSNPERAANRPSRKPENKRVANRAYYEANREAEKQRAVAYARGAGREAKRKRDARRRAIKKGSSLPGELFSLDDIFIRDGGVCHICGLNVDRPSATMDHVIPITLGGPHTLANVKLAHRGCNARKGNRLRAVTQ